ncbi:MAG: hypothetical protein A2632_02940 [Candidatus Pacebacteria bacterium RIFCSPHIGHO2_01_FULL_46_16]|nr:MAG: hypothetical protein A2632_02940 [Candidatus Pacebacteria bacterium RIFCSPHIGHO2_01_FULL_46_16]OGJ21180.1 MAG: hypothetical protein A3J60_01375 [Candidatus Pacebacteria bacterium RIFCSPHIGHO2_02_FULL_46_9]OGJ38950.1 MAG: hypothetical protein A3A82_02255 [Candidatus Pacebacteria bacterium RIFCSPLOWO2_01_FULL_47_12]
MKKLILLSVIGLLLRFVGQPDIPAGFHRDEAGIAYSAYSILKTGKDDWGQWLPLHTRALGDYPPAFYNYLTALLIPFVGLNELAERLPAILFGTLFIPLSFFWVRKLFRDERLAWLVAAIVTISPWDIVQSRAGSESIVALTLTLLAWLLWSRWLRKPKKWQVPVIALLYCFALFSYNAVKLALPLLHLLLVWYWWKDVRKKLLASIFSVLFAVFAFGSVYLLPGAADNFAGNSIFKTNEPVGQEYFFREGNQHVPVVVSRIFHNKLTSLTTQIMGNFGTLLGSNFLFFQAAEPGRYEVPGAGQLLPFFAPFLLLGVFVSHRFTKRQRVFLFVWILLALLPAVITTTAFPHVKRSMYFFLPLYIFSAEGLLLTITWVKPLKLGRLLLSALTFAGVWSFSYFLNQYLVHTQYETILARDYGYKAAYEFIATVESKYDTVQVFGSDESPEIFYFFYRKIDPKLVQAAASQRSTNIFSALHDRQSWSLGKYSFIAAECPSSGSLKLGILYFTHGSCVPAPEGDPNKGVFATETNILQETYYPNSDKRFVIFEKSE